jgi:predicted transcriptional regulator
LIEQTLYEEKEQIKIKDVGASKWRSKQQEVRFNNSSDSGIDDLTSRFQRMKVHIAENINQQKSLVGQVNHIQMSQSRQADAPIGYVCGQTG